MIVNILFDLRKKMGLIDSFGFLDEFRRMNARQVIAFMICWTVVLFVTKITYGI